jgi:hypothetical protein
MHEHHSYRDSESFREFFASAHYDLALQEFLKGTNGDLTGAVVVKTRLMRVSAYTFSQAHQFASSLPAAIATDVTLGTKTANGAGANPGCFDAADATFVAVPAGAAIDCLACFIDSGTPSTSKLLWFIDGFTVTPNGGDITVQWQSTAPFIAKL